MPVASTTLPAVTAAVLIFVFVLAYVNVVVVGVPVTV
jgi:hypothetical protein